MLLSILSCSDLRTPQIAPCTAGSGWPVLPNLVPPLNEVPNGGLRGALECEVSDSRQEEHEMIWELLRPPLMPSLSCHRVALPELDQYGLVAEKRETPIELLLRDRVIE